MIVALAREGLIICEKYCERDDAKIMMELVALLRISYQSDTLTTTIIIEYNSITTLVWLELRLYLVRLTRELISFLYVLIYLSQLLSLYRYDHVIHSRILFARLSLSNLPSSLFLARYDSRIAKDEFLLCMSIEHICSSRTYCTIEQVAHFASAELV